MTEEPKKSRFASFFSRNKKAAQAEIAELADKAEDAIHDAGRKAGAMAADVKHGVTSTTKKAVSTTKTTTKKAVSATKATTKKVVGEVEDVADDVTKNVKKAVKPVASAVKVRTGTPDASWSVSELKEYAKKKGLSGYSSLGKTELLALVKKAK